MGSAKGLLGCFSVVLGGWLWEVDFVFVWDFGHRKVGGLFGWDYLYATHELACLVCVAGDLPVAWSLGTCGCTSAFDGVDGKDAVLGMSCVVGTRPEVLGARQGFVLGWLAPWKVMLLGV